MAKLSLLTETLLPIKKDDVLAFNPQQVIPNGTAIMFDNFLRDELTFELIKSIQKYYPHTKMYIAEQGVFNPEKDLLYKKLTEAGHQIVYCGFDAGLSVCRNTLLEYIKEPYIFICDNDNLFLPETNLTKLKDILESNKNLGFISCYEYFEDNVNHYEKFLEIKNKKLIYKNASESIKHPYPYSYFYCDMTMNVGLFKREVFEDAKWDKRMKLAEHADFFLTLKFKTNWKVGCCTEVFITNQNIVLENEFYKQYRGRNADFWVFYKKKWNLDNIDGWIIPGKEGEKSNNTTAVVNNIIPDEKMKLIPAKITTPEEIIHTLSDINVNYWFLKDSCLDILKFNFLSAQKTFILGTDTVTNKAKIQEVFIKSDFQFEIIIEANRKTKHYDLYGVDIKVPIPVVDYLENLYGQPFNDLMKK